MVRKRAWQASCSRCSQCWSRVLAAGRNTIHTTINAWRGAARSCLWPFEVRHYRVYVDPGIAHQRSLEASLTVQTVVYMCHDPKSMIQTLRYARHSVKYVNRHPRPPPHSAARVYRARSEPKVLGLRTPDAPRRRRAGLLSQMDQAAKPGRLAARLEVERLLRRPYSSDASLRTGSTTPTRVSGGGRAHGRVGNARRVLRYDG